MRMLPGPWGQRGWQEGWWIELATEQPIAQAVLLSQALCTAGLSPWWGCGASALALAKPGGSTGAASRKPVPNLISPET